MRIHYQPDHSKSDGYGPEYWSRYLLKYTFCTCFLLKALSLLLSTFLTSIRTLTTLSSLWWMWMDREISLCITSLDMYQTVSSTPPVIRTCFQLISCAGVIWSQGLMCSAKLSCNRVFLNYLPSWLWKKIHVDDFWCRKFHNPLASHNSNSCVRHRYCVLLLHFQRIEDGSTFFWGVGLRVQQYITLPIYVLFSENFQYNKIMLCILLLMINIFSTALTWLVLYH